MLNKGFPTKSSPLPLHAAWPGLLDPAPQAGLGNTEHVLHPPPVGLPASKLGEGEATVCPSFPSNT